MANSGGANYSLLATRLRPPGFDGQTHGPPKLQRRRVRNSLLWGASMRRGLISRSSAELPDAVLDARLARLRAAMADAHLDALVLYTNNTRTAAVSWLTGFVPY